MGVLTRPLAFMTGYTPPPPSLSIAQWATVTSWFTTGGNGTTKTVTGLSWSSGDIVVAYGGLASMVAGNSLSTPTNANLTFTLQTSVTTGVDQETGSYLWTATAGSSQTSQTITSQINTSGGSEAHGIAVWVVTGSPSGTTNAASNQTETAFSLTTTADSIVIYALDDWNATNPPNRTMMTGSGTSTERRDAGDATTHAQYMGEWVGTSSGTFGFGPNTADGSTPTTADYTSLKVSQAIIEVLA